MSACVPGPDETLLLLIRHGRTDWNRGLRVQGQIDVPLCREGIEEVRLLARSLEPVRAVYSSDLVRARATAEPLALRQPAGAGEDGAGETPVRLEARFREVGLGEFEGLTLEEIRSRYPDQFHAWRSDALRHRPPGGETLEALQERCMAAVREHAPAHPGAAVAVVAHGGPIRVMVCGLLGMPLEVYPRLRVENTSVTRILLTPRGTILAGFNDTSHLRAGGAA